jgi:hypothetical protein
VGGGLRAFDDGYLFIAARQVPGSSGSRQPGSDHDVLRLVHARHTPVFLVFVFLLVQAAGDRVGRPRTYIDRGGRNDE